jgi:sodium-dependent dicarboxylate transporter 2/3/5
MRKPLRFLLGPALALAIAAMLYASGETMLLSKTAAVFILMAYWWITESVNIFITSLLPVILFPMLGIMGIEQVAPQYMKDVMFLYIGGFVLTYAIERWHLHKRISLGILLKTGGSPSRILFGFSIATYCISMWLNNTSTTLMMLPVALAILNQIEGGYDAKSGGLTTALLLAIAFASSIGGTASLVGTLPNMVMKKFYDENFQDATQLDFASWMLVALPISFVVLLCMYFVLNYLFVRNGNHITPDMHSCRDAYKKLGKMSYEEKVIAYVFCIAVLLWFTLDDKQLGSLTLHGWKYYLLHWKIIPDEKFINESYVSIFIASILFFYPSKNKKGESLVTWQELKHLPVGILFLFGGGFALSEGVKSSGLNAWLGDHLLFISELPLWGMILVICLCTTLFSEFASNTATVILFLTVMMPVIQQTSVPPLLISFPLALAASFSFMLPAGTPPNTIVYGTEKLKARDMMRAGFYLDILGAIIITVGMLTLGRWVFGI